MAGRGSVKLSIYSTFKDDGTKKAERALAQFAKKYGEVDKATGKINLNKVSQQLAILLQQLSHPATSQIGLITSIHPIITQLSFPQLQQLTALSTVPHPHFLRCFTATLTLLLTYPSSTRATIRLL